MPPTPEQLTQQIKGILSSVRMLPDEASSPILHYQRTGTEIWGAVSYFERPITNRARSQPVVARHVGHLYGMALVNLIETFERFLKEIAAECVDRLVPLVADDRFNQFPAVQPATLASHFAAGSPGRALCESAIWLNCQEINDRFRRLLGDPMGTGTPFYLFPPGERAGPGRGGLAV